MKLNISLMLPDEVREATVALSRHLAKKYDTRFVLGEENHPHITVYATDFLEAKTEDVYHTLETIAAFRERIDCGVSQLEAHQGYVGVKLIRSSALQYFHELVIQGLSPFRNQERSAGKEYAMSFSSEQHKSMDQYGYPDAMGLYNPHFTISRTEDEEDAELALPEIDWDVSEFTLLSYGIYTTGDNGTCKNLLQRYGFCR